MTFEEWEKTLPEEIKSDSLWKMSAYRLALFAADLGWQDVSRLMKDRRTWSVADQLFRSLGSVSANLAEGYSRGSGRDQARFYEYALGSARESRDWYYKARHVLGESIVEHRIRLLSQVIRLLLRMVPTQRRRRPLREPPQRYQTGPAELAINDLEGYVNHLLHDVPLPE